MKEFDYCIFSGYMYGYAIILGFGWDEAIPFRPWPGVWIRKRTEGGNVASGVSFLGLYIAVGRRA